MASDIALDRILNGIGYGISLKISSNAWKKEEIKKLIEADRKTLKQELKQSLEARKRVLAEPTSTSKYRTILAVTMEAIDAVFQEKQS